MCGIVGCLNPPSDRPVSEMERIVRRMRDTMVPRGPDGAGVWVDPDNGVGLAHRRLSILDLSPSGDQPMPSASGRYVISYNGEIYNHADLAGELTNAGVRLRGHSDTEVLVEAIDRWGLMRTLDRVDGMFAFALWDVGERTVSLVRDRMGEKPLYHGTLGNGEVVFASTLDALRVHPAFDRPVDRDALAMYFRFKYVPAPWSIYQGCHKVPPGCVVTIDRNGRVGDPVPYWSYFDLLARAEPFAGSEVEAVDELDRLLRRSVARRMVADVPVGAFLSGGIDSSTVVAAAQHGSSRPVRTFTIGSTDTSYDEATDARSVADHLGTDHTELIITDADARATVPRLGLVTDEPFGDSSLLPTLLVSELARRDVTVALSGDAGDELFCGYNRYVWVPSIWRRLSRLPVGLRRPGATVLGRVPPRWWDGAAKVVPASRRPRQVGLKVTKVLGIADAPDEHSVFHRLVSHWQHPDRLVPGALEPRTVHTLPKQWPRVAGIADHMAAVDAVTYLPDDILTKVDRATMAVSLEGRIPLLDREILGFAASLPLQMKLRDGSSKWVLRELLSRSVPRSTFERPKSGFGVPIEEWLRGPLRPWAEDLLHSAPVRSVLACDLIDAAWRDHQAGRRNLGYELWDVVMFAAWCDERALGDLGGSAAA